MQEAGKVPQQSKSIKNLADAALITSAVFGKPHADKITFSVFPSLLTLIRLNLWTAALWRKSPQDLSTVPGNILPFRLNNGSNFSLSVAMKHL